MGKKDEKPEEQTTDDNEPADEEHNPDKQTDEGTYPAKIVKDLRKENAAHRERIQKLSRELFTARVEATGKLVNASELDFDSELLDDADAMNAAIDELVESKPYLKPRTASGDVGQGQRGKDTAPQDFSQLLLA